MIRMLRAAVSTANFSLKLFRDWRNYRRQPVNEFTINGYEIIQQFFTPADCKYLVDLANRYANRPSGPIDKGAYVLKRRDTGAKTDREVIQLMNLQEIDPWVADLFASKKIETMFTRRMNEEMRLQGIGIQIDDIDTETKRGYHIDTASPPSYKGFIYLNDVLQPGDGAYTVIPRSHRDIWKKLANRFYSEWKGYNKTDTRLYYNDDASIPVLAPQGTLILSCQHLAHKGWHHQDRQRRYMMVLFLVQAKHWKDQTFKLEKDLPSAGQQTKKAA